MVILTPAQVADNKVGNVEGNEYSECEQHGIQTQLPMEVPWTENVAQVNIFWVYFSQSIISSHGIQTQLPMEVHVPWNESVTQ